MRGHPHGVRWHGQYLLRAGAYRQRDETGKIMESLLDRVQHTATKHCANDTRSAFVTSGIRVGSPAGTSRGLKEKEFEQVARWIARIAREGEACVEQVKAEVTALMANYPLYE